jgi:hypothetical protein
VLVTNLTSGLQVSGWTNEQNQWLEPAARADLDVLRAALAQEDPDRPVVFVIDDEPPEPFQIYGFSKLSGNTSRYGLPPQQIDRGYLYLGEVALLLADSPTERGDDTYDPLSVALLDDTREGIERSGLPPIVVIAEAFNPAGANVELASGDAPLTVAPSGLPEGTDVWTLYEGSIYGSDGSPVGIDSSGLPNDPPAAIPHALRVIVGLLVLAIPGGLLLRRFLPDADVADALGLVPALGLGITTLVGIVVIAIMRSPFSAGLAGITALAAVIVGVIVRVGPRRQMP